MCRGWEGRVRGGQGTRGGGKECCLKSVGDCRIARGGGRMRRRKGSVVLGERGDKRGGRRQLRI